MSWTCPRPTGCGVVGAFFSFKNHTGDSLSGPPCYRKRVLPNRRRKWQVRAGASWLVRPEPRPSSTGPARFHPRSICQTGVTAPARWLASLQSAQLLVLFQKFLRGLPGLPTGPGLRKGKSELGQTFLHHLRSVPHATVTVHRPLMIAFFRRYSVNKRPLLLPSRNLHGVFTVA